MKILAQFVLFVVISTIAPMGRVVASPSSTPEIHIEYAFLMESQLRSVLPQDLVATFPRHTREELIQKTEADSLVWEKYEEPILQAMQEKLELEFYRDIIDVYRMSDFDITFSDPPVISMSYRGDDFVSVLTHELSHRLLTGNTRHLPVIEIWSAMFPGEPRLTRDHVLVFATLQYVFLDVLHRPDMLAEERDVPDLEYLRAWRIVDERGYESIIQDFKNRYPKDTSP